MVGGHYVWWEQETAGQLREGGARGLIANHRDLKVERRASAAGVPVDAASTEERKEGGRRRGLTGGDGVSTAQRKKKKEAGSWAAVGGS
jgi:hypothetical protein